MQIETPAALLQRALGDEGFGILQEERGKAEAYGLSPVQADAVLRLTLGQLVNLEQEKLSGEHSELLTKIREFLRILSSEENIRGLIRADWLAIESKFAQPRRTEISGEVADIRDLAELITKQRWLSQLLGQATSNGRRLTPIEHSDEVAGSHEGDESDPVEHFFVQGALLASADTRQGVFDASL